MRLIDANKLNARLSRNATPYFTVCDIDSAPTVDAVQVIRCKDCKYYFPPTNTKATACSYIGGGMLAPRPNDFCSYGKAR